MTLACPFIVTFVGPDAFIVPKDTLRLKVRVMAYSLNHVVTVPNGVTPPKIARVTLMNPYVLNVKT